MRDFVPLRPGHVVHLPVRATVQGPPHIGHIRSGVAFDVLRRWLTPKGYDVAFIRNVTDIDDKILTRPPSGPSVVGVGRHLRARVRGGLRRAGVLPPR